MSYDNWLTATFHEMCEMADRDNAIECDIADRLLHDDGLPNWDAEIGAWSLLDAACFDLPPALVPDSDNLFDLTGEGFRALVAAAMRIYNEQVSKEVAHAYR